MHTSVSAPAVAVVGNRGGPRNRVHIQRQLQGGRSGGGCAADICQPTPHHPARSAHPHTIIMPTVAALIAAAAALASGVTTAAAQYHIDNSRGCVRLTVAVSAHAYVRRRLARLLPQQCNPTPYTLVA